VLKKKEYSSDSDNYKYFNQNYLRGSQPMSTVEMSKDGEIRTERFRIGRMENISRLQASQVLDFMEDTASELLLKLNLNNSEIFDTTVNVSIEDTRQASQDGENIVLSNPSQYDQLVRDYPGDLMPELWERTRPAPFHQVQEELGHFIGEKSSGWRPQTDYEGMGVEETRRAIKKDSTRDELHGALAIAQFNKKPLEYEIQVIEQEIEELEDLYSEQEIDYILDVKRRIEGGLEPEESIESYREFFEDVRDSGPSDSRYGNESFSERFLNNNLPDGLDNNVLEGIREFSRVDRSDLDDVVDDYKSEEAMGPVSYFSSRIIALDIVEDYLEVGSEDVFKSEDLGDIVLPYNNCVSRIYDV